MRLPTITLFFSILITNYNLKSMEEKAQQKQLTHYFSDADTSAQKNYSIILSFYEAIFSGCKFKVDAPNGKIMFKNLFSENMYRTTVEQVRTILDSTACPKQYDILHNTVHSTEYENSCKTFKKMSKFKQLILLQGWRLDFFLQDPLNNIFEKQDFINYLKKNNNGELLPIPDGFNVTKISDSDYLDHYWTLLKQRNENRKKFFELNETIKSKYDAGETIESNEHCLSLLNKSLYIDFTPLNQQHKLLKQKISSDESKCIIS